MTDLIFAARVVHAFVAASRFSIEEGTRGFK